MASRKLLRDLYIAQHPLFRQLLAPPPNLSRGGTRLRLIPPANGYVGRREFGVFNEFSKKIKGEVDRNEQFQQSVKELKEKAEELKEAKENLKARTKQTTEQLYKQVDDVWTEAEVKAKKVYANVEEKISAAKAEVQGTFGTGKQDASESTGTSNKANSNGEESARSANGEEKQQEQHQQMGQGDNAETLFGKVKYGVSSTASMAFQKLKEAKPIDLAKKGYGIVKDELKGSAGKRRHLGNATPSADPSLKVERSTRTDIVVLPSQQSKWSKKWDSFMDKMRGYPLYKRAKGFSKPVVTKGQEIAEEVRERWETSDHPVVHKIQDINESVFGESDTALSFKEIRQRDPQFSLPEFVAEVQEIIKPVLVAYFKGDHKVLSEHCGSEIVERCKAEHNVFATQGITFEHKILHVSEAEVKETKLMGDTPIIIVVFQTQQVYCVRDKQGNVTEGGKDTIHTVYYAWAMQLVDGEEVHEGETVQMYSPRWKLREMQQYGVQALI